MNLRCLTLFVLCCCACVVCKTGQVQAAPLVVKDVGGKPVRIHSTERIVSLNGTLTETLFALGVGKRLVGRDTSSYYPKAALRLPTVGYQHRLNAEGVLRLRPTLVVGLTSVKPHTVLEQIRKAGVTVLLLPPVNDAASSQRMIQTLGRVVGKEKQATSLLQAIGRNLNKLKKARATYKKRPRVLFLYLRGHRLQFVLGKGTFVDGLLELIGADNAVSIRRAKPLSTEGLVVAKPDVIVAFAKGVRSIGGLKSLQKLPGVSLTSAGRSKRFVVMDDLYLGGFGPRFAMAALDLFHGVFVAKGTYIKR